MSTKRISFIFCLVILSVFLGALLIHTLSKDDDKLFLGKVNSIDKIILSNVTHFVTLTNEESQLLKKIIISQFKEEKYQRKKMDDRRISVGMVVPLFDKSTLVGYFPQTKQLYFEPIWFIPDNLNKNEVGEYIFKTKDMLLTINDEIDKMLIKYGLIVE